MRTSKELGTDVCPPPIPAEGALPAPRVDGGDTLHDDCAAVGADWIRLAAELDASAAAWKATASAWTRDEPRGRGAAARVEWAVERTRGLTTWWRQLAKDLLRLK